MASLFSNTEIGFWSSTSNKLIGNLTGNVTRSGNTVTLSSMVLTITSSTVSYGSGSFTITIGGVSTELWLSPGGSSSFGQHSLNNVSFGVATSASTATVGWASSDGYSGSFPVSFPSPPQGLSISGVQAGQDSISATVSVSNWGNGGSTSSRTLELSVCSAQSVSNRRLAQAKTPLALSATITVNNSTQTGNITLAPNTQYYLTSYATNGAMSTGNSSFQVAVTLPPVATLEISAISTTSATIDYSVPADGGRYQRMLEYSLDAGTTWTNAADVSKGEEESGSFTISGLSPNTGYTMLSRVSTEAGTSENQNLAFTTSGDGGALSLYASVGGLSKRINTLYGSVDGRAKRVTKVYASVDGHTKLIA